MHVVFGLKIALFARQPLAIQFVLGLNPTKTGATGASARGIEPSFCPERAEIRRFRKMKPSKVAHDFPKHGQSVSSYLTPTPVDVDQQKS
jgi:hypothetical protein